MRASTSSARTDPGTVVDGGTLAVVLVVVVVVIVLVLVVVLVVDLVDVVDTSVVGSMGEPDSTALAMVGVARIVLRGGGGDVAGADVVTAAVSSSSVSGS